MNTICPPQYALAVRLNKHLAATPQRRSSKGMKGTTVVHAIALHTFSNPPAVPGQGVNARQAKGYARNKGELMCDRRIPTTEGISTPRKIKEVTCLRCLDKIRRYGMQLNAATPADAQP